MNRTFILFLLSFVIYTIPVKAQLIVPGAHFRHAILLHTRNADGAPGDKYWQNTARYLLKATLTKNNTIEGAGSIVYINNSPDTLNQLQIKLYQNLHRSTALRAIAVDTAYFTSGIHLTRLEAQGTDYLSKPTQVLSIEDGACMVIKLSKPLLPHDSVIVSTDWYYKLNNSVTTSARESIINPSSVFAAYWYPRIAVYDDIDGWDNTIQNELSEFYNDFCDYDVTLQLPAGYTAWATGTLTNAASVLSDGTRQLLQSVEGTDAVVKRITTGGTDLVADSLPWHYTANHVTDFTWAAALNYNWDAVHVPGKTTADDVFINVAYTSRNGQYARVADVAAQCVEYYSKSLPGVAFPFRHISIFEGRSQMEYPMMVNDNDEAVYHDMVSLTAHELSHMYFPFTMGINETRYAWMDEGWATFFEYHFMKDGMQLTEGLPAFFDFYKRRFTTKAPSISSMPLMSPSDQLLSDAYIANSYTKGWLMYETVRSVLGDTLFTQALQNYIKTWRGKHPTPYDYFNNWKNFTHKDIDWIFKAFAFNYATFDVALGQVRETEGSVEVAVKNMGGLPESFTAEATLTNGKTVKQFIPVHVWQSSTETHLKIKLPKHAHATHVKITTGVYPDINPTDKDSDIIIKR